MNTMLFLGMGGQEIIIVALIVLLLFGGKKIPELMRGLGRGVKEFKDAKDGIRSEIHKGMNEENKPSEN
jgi:sec-independent protein translocase protein TatA